MKAFKLFLFLFLLGVTIFSVFQYFSALKEKYGLLGTIEDMKAQVGDLEKEKLGLEVSLEKEKIINDRLSQENLDLKEILAASEEKLALLDAEFKETLEKVEELRAHITDLENKKESLTLELGQVTAERDEDKVKMSSIPELKKLIKELKRKVHNTTKVVKEQIKKQVEKVEKVILGNRGYLIKDGKNTSSPKVRIEVMPAIK